MISNEITLIIAEDDDGQYILTEKYLRRFGITNEIIRFNNGEQLQNFLESSILRREIQGRMLNCILILDINMPKKNGIEVLHYMKQNDLLDQMPTIMFSSCSDLETSIECFDLGIRYFIAKPVGPDMVESIEFVATEFATV